VIGQRLSALATIKSAVDSRSEKFFKRQPKIYPDIREAIRKLRKNNTTLAERSASLIVLRSLIKVEGGYSFSHDPRLVARSIFRFNEKEVRNFVMGIKCPVLLFWTKNTVEKQSAQKVGNSSLQQIFQERFELLNPNISKFIVLEEGEHHVHLDRPELVLPHIEAFYDQYVHKPTAKL